MLTNKIKMTVMMMPQLKKPLVCPILIPTMINHKMISLNQQNRSLEQYNLLTMIVQMILGNVFTFEILFQIEFSQMSDFDLMMQRRKEENRMKRMKGKKSDSSFIGDADDSINSMLNRMKEAADADKQANIKRQAGISKLKMLNVRFFSF